MFSYYRDSSIYFEEPNYMMVSKYASLYNLSKTDLETADIVYIAYPNGCLLNFPDINIYKLKNKIKIIDLSYYIYTSRCKNFRDFKSFIYELTELDFFVLYGPSKTLGLPGLRVGFCNSNNLEPFKFHQPWQITTHSKLILDKLWNSEIIDKHTSIIKESKIKISDLFNDYIKFSTEGPFLAMSNEFNKLETRNFKNYKRLSIVDYDLLSLI